MYMNTQITVSALVAASSEIVWKAWTTPEDIKQWCFASDDWGVGDVTNDLREGGKFSTYMQAKDGSTGFDFNGVYTAVEPQKKIAYAIADGRTVEILFEEQDGKTLVTETFEMETENPAERQQEGWQAILNSFKRHAESL